MAETSITLTRRVLYARVWAVPLRRLCNEFGLSDRGLAKICARHKIPAPPRGVWAKKAHGKHIRQPPLPPGPSGSDDETITIWRSTSRDSDCTPHPLPEPPEVVDARTYESDPRNRITVSVNVRRFHRIVAQTRAQMKGASENDLTAGGITNPWFLRIRNEDGVFAKYFHRRDLRLPLRSLSAAALACEPLDGC